MNMMRIGISIGDLNGIGPEVVLKTFSEPTILKHCIPIVYASTKSMTWWRKQLHLDHFNFVTLKPGDKIVPGHLYLVDVWEEDINLTPGKELPVTGQYAVKSLNAACKDLEAGKLDALVTAPISKKNVKSNEFPYTGHTEFLAARFGQNKSLMMMISDNLKVALATVHIPVQEISKNISVDSLYRRIELLHQTLRRDFSCTAPKIAVLGLNPHAGEGGQIGKEEQEIILPAIQKAKENKILAMGPFAADGFFGTGQYRHFDAVLAMYHDQGLVPFKTIAFDEGVNYTAGLNIVRTSPDHGTAFDIAGKNEAREDSFRSALFAAMDIARCRKAYDEAAANPLKRNSQEAERGSVV